MAQDLRELKGKMRSVSSMRKITRAFELIAASRVVKAQRRMNESLPYSEAITAALSELASYREAEFQHTYLEPREVRRNAGIIVITADRGQAGAYNSATLREADALVARLGEEGLGSRIYVTGRKGAAYYRFRDRSVAHSWAGFSEHPKFVHAREIASVASREFLDGEIDELYVVYMHFVSSFTQRPVVKRFVPLDVVEDDLEPDLARPLYRFHPSPTAVLEQLLPRYIQSRLYASMLEATASEQASRRRAMSTATDNANALFEEYTRRYNQARQAQITQELMEVVGAVEALAK